MLMDSEFERRRHLSAAHYLEVSYAQGALQTTLDLVAVRFGYPVAVVNILDSTVQYTVAAVGRDTGTHRKDDTLCAEVVARDEPRILDDVHVALPDRADEFPGSYVGVPLRGREGMVVGSLCLMDEGARTFPAEDLPALSAAGLVVQNQLELCRRLATAPAGGRIDPAELARAVEQGEIVPFYQPVVDIRTGAVVAIEALARWEHPRYGLVSPNEFMPLAEDTEIVIDLDLEMIRRSAAATARWSNHHPELRLNVNLSVRHFDHPKCVERITAAVVEAGLSPTSVALEITETVALAAHPGDRDFLQELRARGFSVVLDDFGTGFSVVEKVLRLPIDGIKIDRSVSSQLGTRTGDAVTRALVGLADELQLSIVIEGIATAEQAAHARALGCTHGQGFWWSAPMPGSDFTAYLARHQPPEGVSAPTRLSSELSSVADAVPG